MEFCSFNESFTSLIYFIILYGINNFVIARGTALSFWSVDGPAQGNKREAEKIKILSKKFLITNTFLFM